MTDSCPKLHSTYKGISKVGKKKAVLRTALINLKYKLSCLKSNYSIL